MCQLEQILTNIYNMNEMSKTKMMTFYVEGPDWEQNVSLDPTLFDDERSQLFEAASLAIEKQMKIPLEDDEDFNLGALLLVRKSKTAKKEAMVNAYICLVNVGQYQLAEELRANFKKETGNDLASDKTGYEV